MIDRWDVKLREWGVRHWDLTDYRIIVGGLQVAAAHSPEWGRAYLTATGRTGQVTFERNHK